MMKLLLGVFGFCGEKYCSRSMVRPLLNAVIEKHLKHNISDDEIAEHFKNEIYIITKLKIAKKILL